MASFSDRLSALKAQVGTKRKAAASTAEEQRRKKILTVKKLKGDEALRKKREEVESQQKKTGIWAVLKTGMKMEWPVGKAKLQNNLPTHKGSHHSTWIVDVASEGTFHARILNEEFEKKSTREIRKILNHSIAREHTIQTLVGRTGIGFRTAFSLKEFNCIIHHKSTESDLKKCEESDVQGKIALFSSVLKKLHGTEAPAALNGHSWNVFTGIEDLVSWIKSEGKPLPIGERFQEIETLISQWREILSAHHPDGLSKSYVCHNNLRAADLFSSTSSSRIFITDFSYAALGDRYYDLAQFARLNKLSSSQNIILLKSYFGDYQQRQLACFSLLSCLGKLFEGLQEYVCGEIDGSKEVMQNGAAKVGKFLEEANDETLVKLVGEELMK
eukprot:TRINITY_DN19683_c0_g1_i1.p1 TRINITY_DN19683_c0_g1~~TRINITY_DN19683_c0_g1_i1.p1  ORF type:complete len:386 (+),score=63.32 TRINITY_DN19683_c0_g1_i1:62-1219(+)